MKRNISDLMEHIHAVDVEPESNTPLSSQRIKELTMRKTEQKKPNRTAFRIFLAAAIIAALGISAFAAETIFHAGDVIKNFFRDDISEEQVAAMNKLGGDFKPQTVTSEGTSVTLAAAYADDSVMTLYLQVEAPEGTVLPDGIAYELYDYNDRSVDIIEIPAGQGYKYIAGVTIDIAALPDDNPEDNRKDFCVTLYAQQGQKAKFNDGVPKRYNITGIFEQVVNADMDEDGYVRLAPGSFSFDIGIAGKMEQMVLDVAGLTYGGTKSRTWTCGFETCGEYCEGLETNGREHTEYWDVSITAETLVLTPLSAQWSCHYEHSNPRASDELDFAIVMKDGSSPEMYAASGGTYGDDYSEGVVNFRMPIDLADVDYILIGDPQLGEVYKVYPQT